jgi:CCR4-NOT transcriptional regulation complex NOT5 subunit
MRRRRSSESDSSDSNNVDMADVSLTTCTVTRDTVTPVLQSITAKINHLTITNTLNTPARQLIGIPVMIADGTFDGWVLLAS